MSPTSPSEPPHWRGVAIGLFVLILVYALVTILAGCTRSESQTASQTRGTTTLSGSIPMAGADGVIRPQPVTMTLSTRESTTSETQTKEGLDGAAIGQQIGAAAAAAISAGISAAPGGSALSWVGDAATALLVGTTGYLAVKKREQMKAPKPFSGRGAA